MVTFDGFTSLADICGMVSLGYEPDGEGAWLPRKRWARSATAHKALSIPTIADQVSVGPASLPMPDEREMLRRPNFAEFWERTRGVRPPDVVRR